METKNEKTENFDDFSIIENAGEFLEEAIKYAKRGSFRLAQKAAEYAAAVYEEAADEDAARKI